jgi:hypothetical protein
VLRPEFRRIAWGRDVIVNIDSKRPGRLCGRNASGNQNIGADNSEAGQELSAAQIAWGKKTTVR